MHICDEKTFERLVARNPQLCAWGMGSESLCRFDSVFFRANRRLLMNSYRDFVICCSWLREQCAAVKTVSAKSPTSRQLQRLANSPHYVGHGAMIAAILYMKYPYKVDPHSTSIQAGISLNSPCFRSQLVYGSTMPEHLTNGKRQPAAAPPEVPTPGHRGHRAVHHMPGIRSHQRLPLPHGV